MRAGFFMEKPRVYGQQMRGMASVSRPVMIEPFIIHHRDGGPCPLGQAQRIIRATLRAAEPGEQEGARQRL